MFKAAILKLNLQQIMSLLAFLGGLSLIVAVSAEVLSQEHNLSQGYLALQAIVCVIFLGDFAIRWRAEHFSTRFLFCNALYLLLSIPYLNIVRWCGAELSHEWEMLIGLAPLARVFLALYIMVRWLSAGRFKQIFTAYTLSVVLFTYLAALIFYDYEAPLNTHLHGFGNALWWAWMNVTTVGAAVFPVTAIGKIFAVLLPILGMMMFPIFTVYVVKIFTNDKKQEK